MHDAVWVFDSVCVLCSRGVQFTLKHERKPSIRFVAIGSKEGRRLASQNGINPDDPATFLFIENGQVKEKSDGVIALSQHLRGPIRLCWILKGVPKPLRDAIYDVVARNRYRIFGQMDQCLVPDQDQRHRFVLV
ncbi:MAG: DCC1-like thiol-disulfide oxidoreductase family protein [Sulfitobacter sp.]